MNSTTQPKASQARLILPFDVYRLVRRPELSPGIKFGDIDGELLSPLYLLFIPCCAYLNFLM